MPNPNHFALPSTQFAASFISSSTKQASDIASLAYYYTGTTWRSVTATKISKTLTQAGSVVGPRFFTQPSLDPGQRRHGVTGGRGGHRPNQTDGPVALGCHTSLPYHPRAVPTMRHFASKMLQGDYVLNTNGTVPLH